VPEQGASESVVRPTTHDDVEALLDLMEAVAAEGRWIATEAPFDRAARGDRFHAGVDSPAVGSFVADLGGEIVGSFGIELAPYGVAEFGMMVAVEHRGRGIGSALLQTGIEWAREAGAHKVALQRWPHNPAAQALYERFGFVEEGRLRRHYRRNDGSLWDAVVMGLVLDEDSPGTPEVDESSTDR
jgi:RimJ/RimL family protein N-acetyltransferase